MYDVAIVGAGINGVASAFRLARAGLRVAVFDKDGVASGGSGAAGAFLSPKFVKSGELKQLVNTALLEAFSFYETHFPQHFKHTHLLHIAKDEKDTKNLRYVKQNDDIPFLPSPPFTPSNEYIYTDASAIVDARSMCEALLDGVEFFQEDIKSLQKDRPGWILNEAYKAKRVVLATGAYGHLIDEAYVKMAIRGIWGHRIDVESDLHNEVSIHQFVSISPNKNGIISIGATHDVHFHPKSAKRYDYEKGREELFAKARKTLDIKGEVVQDYVGLRSGSSDYLPLIGEVVDMKMTLKKLGKRSFEKKEQDFSSYVYHKELYIINGSAGYGFVLAPVLSRILCERIVEQKELPKHLDVARFVARYIRRHR